MTQVLLEEAPAITAEMIAENRRKVVTHLRTTDVPQNRYGLHDAETGAYCGIGHIGLAVGIDAATDDTGIGTQDDIYLRISRAVDMDAETLDWVLDMNDGFFRPLPEIGGYLANTWGVE